MNVEEMKKYWVDSSDEDFETMLIMHKTKRRCKRGSK